MLLQARIVPDPARKSIDAVSAVQMRRSRNVYSANIQRVRAVTPRICLRCEITFRSLRNKHKSHDLPSLCLAYVVDVAHGFGPMHHVYTGNVSDGGERPEASGAIEGLLDRIGISLDTGTLTPPKASAVLDDTPQPHVPSA